MVCGLSVYRADCVLRLRSGEVRFKVRQRAVGSPCRCGSGVGIYTFYKIITKYINEDLKNINENDLPRDGIGCWHPTFPARSDDIWEATSIAVKNIEKYVNSDKTEQVSLVYEQKDNIYYEGYTLIDKCEGE